VSDFIDLLNFARDMNAKLVFGLNEISGRDCHFDGSKCRGNWDTTNAKQFLQYIHDNNIGPIFGFELGNEITRGGHLTMQENIQDYQTLSTIMKSIWAKNPSANHS